MQRYAHALEQCRNMFISPQGGSVRRSGTRYVIGVPDQTNYTRLIDFRFSTTSAVVLEFSNGLIRFYQNQGIILSGLTPYSVVSPYATVDLPNLKFTQSADIVYIFNPKYPTQLLSRFGNTNWTIAPVTLIDGPYLPLRYIDGITLASHDTIMTCPTLAMGASGTCTSSSALVPAQTVFVATDVGRHIRLYNGTGILASTLVGWAIITNFIDGNNVTVKAQSAIQSATGVNWNLGAISVTTGYPSCGTFFQQRFVMASTPAQPSGLFFSNSGDFYNMGPSLFDTTVTDACGIAYSIASNQVNTILWLSPSQVLIVGTDGAEWQVSSNSYNASPVTPTNIMVSLQTSNGSQNTSRPLRVGWETVFVARTGRDVFKLVYTFQINGFVADSLSLLGEHIPREGNQLIDIAYQQFPHSILWMPRLNDGALAALTYLNEQQIVGWHLHEIGGSFGSQDYAFVESVAVIPTPDGTKDQLWMVVKRTVNGNTTRYVEYMEVPFDKSDTAPQNMCFLDAAITQVNGSPSSLVTGLSHLEGQSVEALVDGSAVSGLVVSGGHVTLPNPGTIVTVGLPFESRMKVLRLDGGGSAGTGQGKLKRINKVTLRLYETLGFEWSVNGDDDEAIWNEVDFRDASDPMGSAPPLFTGDYQLPIDQPVGYEGQYWIRQTRPYPLTCVALMPEAMVYQ